MANSFFFSVKFWWRKTTKPLWLNQLINYSKKITLWKRKNISHFTSKIIYFCCFLVSFKQRTVNNTSFFLVNHLNIGKNISLLFFKQCKTKAFCTSSKCFLFFFFFFHQIELSLSVTKTLRVYRQFSYCSRSHHEALLWNNKIQTF